MARREEGKPGGGPVYPPYFYIEAGVNQILVLKDSRVGHRPEHPGACARHCFQPQHLLFTRHPLPTSFALVRTFESCRISLCCFCKQVAIGGILKSCF